MSVSANKQFDIYKSVHKALRLFLFNVSASIGKFDPIYSLDRASIKADFDELSSFLRDHAEHEDNHFHNLIDKKFPVLFASLEQQHKQAEADWLKVEHEAEMAFSDATNADAADWQRFYLAFNQFIINYLTHLQHEELVALPALWAAASDEELMNGLQEMFKRFTPEIIARSKKWCLLSCSLSELKAMQYVE